LANADNASALYKVLHLHGQPSIPAKKQTWGVQLLVGLWILLSSTLSLGTLATHKQVLDDIRVDHGISKSRWEYFMAKTQAELARGTILVNNLLVFHTLLLTPPLQATVLLAANLAFLAIPAVYSASRPALMSQISIFASLASIGSGYPLIQKDWFKPGPQVFSHVCSIQTNSLDCETHTFLHRCNIAASSCFLPCHLCCFYGRESVSCTIFISCAYYAHTALSSSALGLFS
jgi:hypothetical protein